MWLDCDPSHKDTVTSFTLLKLVKLCQNKKAVYETEVAIICILANKTQNKKPENGQ